LTVQRKEKKTATTAILLLLGSGTDPASLLILLLLFLLGDPLQKSLGSVVLNWIWMKFGRIVIQVNIHTELYSPQNTVEVKQNVKRKKENNFKKASHRFTNRVFDSTSHFRHGDHHVISRRKVLPLGEWIRSIYRRL